MRLPRSLILAVVIHAVIPAGVELKPVTDALRQAAIKAGCDEHYSLREKRSQVGMLVRSVPESNAFEIVVECEGDGDDR